MQCVRYFQETGKKQFIDIKNGQSLKTLPVSIRLHATVAGKRHSAIAALPTLALSKSGFLGSCGNRTSQL